MTESAPARAPRGPYAKGRARRTEILSAAERLFRARGYDAVSLREIAADAGVTHPLVKHYFGTKDNLLIAVLDERAGELAQRIDALEKPEEIRRLATEAATEHVAMTGYLGAFTRLAAEASDAEHPAHRHFRDRYALGVRINSELLDQIREHGALVADLDSATLSRFLIAVQDGLQLQWLYDQDGVRLPELIDAFFELLLQKDASAGAHGAAVPTAAPEDGAPAPRQ